jgi:hypothetical protein
MHKLLFLVLLLNISSAFSQDYTVKGLVKNAENTPLPFVTVFVRELNLGTTTNQEGKFELKLEKGEYEVIFRTLGYTQKEVKISVEKDDNDLYLTLDECNYQLKQVNVKKGTPPEITIMRNAISRAPVFGNMISSYKAEIYSKGSIYIDNIPWLLEKNLEADVDGATINIKEKDTYLLESVNEVTFNAPDTIRQKVISYNSNIKQLEGIFPFTTINIYKNDIDGIISPLSSKAFRYYKFYYEGFFWEGKKSVNKIKVSPRRKGPQFFDGYLYIVDDDWCVHSADLNCTTTFGTINFKINMMPVKKNVWMPVSNKMTVNISKLGFRANVNYQVSIKYAELTENKSAIEKLYPPEKIDTTSPEEHKITKTITKKKKKTTIEDLLQKDELTKREMLKLAMLAKKEQRKETPKLETMETKKTFFYEIDSLANKKDSTYWNLNRKISLSNNEREAIKKIDVPSPSDSLISQADSTKERSVFSIFISEAAFGHQFGNDSTISLSYGGLIVPRMIGYNIYDGLVYGQYLDIQFLKRFSVKPSISYAFGRNKVMWNTEFRMNYSPMKNGSFGIDLGDNSEDYNKEKGAKPIINGMYNLLVKQNYRWMYDNKFVKIHNQTDLINGLNLFSMIAWKQQKQINSYSDYSFFYRDREFESNFSNNNAESINTTNQNSLVTDITLRYTPRANYKVVKGKKIYHDFKYPTIELKYKQGFAINDFTESDFSYVEAGIKQRVKTEFFSELNYKLKAGIFLNSKQVHFSDYAHFKTIAYTISEKTNEAFTLRPMYSLSTSDRFIEMHVNYESKNFILKRLPYLSSSSIEESLTSAVLLTPKGSYFEAGYSLKKVFMMFNVGVYTGTSDFNQFDFGFKVSLPFE